MTPDDDRADDGDFAALLAESERPGMQRRRVTAGEQVRGRIVALGPDRAFVDVGAKAEAVIDLAELQDPSTGAMELAVGDELDATVTDDGSRSGAIVLKRVAGRGGRSAAELEQAFEHGLAIEGLVSGQNKGGFEVQIGTIRAFCPGSQMDLRRGDAAQYLGQRLRFRVIKLEGGGRNVVVSRRSLLEEEAASQAAETMARLEPGAVVRGTVRTLREFGAFVDLGGIEGLIHVSELGHARGRAPEDVLAVGQSVEAKVLRVERAADGRPRVSLSLRALAPDPWAEVSARFPVGTTVQGRVRRLEPFGAFVELAPGIDGLVHVSKVTTARRISHPRQVVSEGDEVTVTVVGVELAKRRIALSMVEQELRAKDAAETEERRDTEATMARQREAGSLGTLGELLAGARKPRS